MKPKYINDEDIDKEAAELAHAQTAAEVGPDQTTHEYHAAYNLNVDIHKHRIMNAAKASGKYRGRR